MKKPPDSPAKSGTKPRPPAFKNSELGPIPADWEVMRLGELCDIQLGKMLDEEKNIGELKPYLGNRAVQWNRIVLEDLPQVRLTDKDKQRYLLRSGDLLVCEGGEVGRAAIWRGELSECYYQKALHRLRARKSDAIDMEFMLQLFHFYAASGLFDSVVTKTSIAHLPKDKLEMLPVACPPLSEQRRIVAVLSDADAWIESLDKLIEKKKLVKQGAMQDLLSGKTRLPGFSGKWEEMQLGEIAIFPTDTVPTDTTRLPDYVGTENMLPDGMGVLQYEDTLPYRNIREYRIGDLLISNIRPYLKKIWLADRNGGCSTDVVVIRTRDKNVLTPEFLFFQLAGDSFFDFVMDNAIGTKMPRGDKRMMGLFSMLVPSLSEQCAITSALSDMDAELASLSREKAKAEQIKQGMMQELLTGRVRLA